MKNRTLKSLSVLLSICLLGTSPVSATDFSDGSDFTEDSTQAQTDTNSAVADPTATDDFSADDATDDTAAFDSEDEIFTDEETNSEFSSDEVETEEAPVAGGLENSISTHFNYSIVEADIENDPSLKTICDTYKGSNLESQDYEAWATTIDSYLTTSPDGNLMRVQAGALDGKLLIEYYDTSYNFKRAMTLDLSLPIFGAFYESNDNYYILTGQNNPDHNDSVETYRVTKYSKDWKAQGSCSLFGANTAQPFAFGTARMMVSGNYLYVRTCHVMYNGHQANVTFSVNTSDMSIMDQYYKVEYTPSGYVSHTFTQFLKMDNGTFLGVDQGDTYPRGINLVKSTIDSSTGRFTKNFSTSVIMDFTLGGGTYTAATVGGFEYSDSSYLVAGSCDIDNTRTTRNVFILSAPKSGDTPVIRYLSNYAGTEDTASAPHLIKTGSNSFIIMWSSQGHVYYTALDGNGQQTSSIYQMVGNLSDCVPVIVNGKLIWYTWKNEVNTFYSINLSNLSENHASRITNGHKFANGTPVNGLMKRSCTACGYQDTVSVPTSINLWKKKEPDSYNYIYMGRSNYMDIGQSADLWWTPNFNSANSSYPELSECEISCSDESVLSIKMNTIDMATITAKKAGKATISIKSKYSDDYVLKTDFYVNMIDSSHSRLSLKRSTYNYDGTEHKPSATLTINGVAATEGTDFKLSYEGDLVNAGTATVTATGIGKYTGSVSTTYRINPQTLTAADTSISVESAYYNGSEQKPAVSVTHNGKKLTPDTDYTVAYTNNIEVTDYARARITGQGNYKGTLTQYFTIRKQDISNCSIILSADSFPYDGSDKRPEVTVKSGNNTLTASSDYTVSYSNNRAVGTATVTISGRNNYTGSASKSFRIVPADIANFTVSLSASTFGYDGSKKKPSATVRSGNKTLTSGTDFTVSYSNNVNVGTASAVITGKGNYSGSITKEFIITPADFSKLTASLATGTFSYDGTEKKPEVTVKSGSKQLTSGTDFTVSYTNNINVGTAKAVITGKGNYSGTITKSFKITQADLSKFTASLSADSFIYDGAEKKPVVTVKSDNAQLTADTDFTVSYSSNINAGTATVTITGKGNYSGSIKKQFTITPADFSGFSAELSADTVTYTGSAQKPGATVKSGDKVLVSGTDFTVSYSNNTNAGTAKATIKGKGNYSGTITKEFTITPADISQLTASLSADIFRYNGTEQKPSVTVKSRDKMLVPDTDFTVSYSDNIDVGTATVNITGQGNYTGSMTRTFTITNARIPAVITAKSVTLNQSTKKTSVFTAETDGKITLKSSNSKIVKVSGTKIIPVAPGKVTLTITAARGQDYEKASKKISVTVRPLTTSKLSLKSTAKKQATVSWTAAKSISRYQIYYSQRSDMKNAKHITAKSSAKSAVLKNLTSKKKYYVRIRTYKTVSGKKYYSTWSSVKSVTVK